MIMIRGGGGGGPGVGGGGVVQIQHFLQITSLSNNLWY